jgi:hypothetical protein
MLGVMCLSVLAGVAYASLPFGAGRRRWLWTAAIGAAVCLESWAALPAPHVPYAWAEVEPPGRSEPIIELPLGPEFDAAATYRSALHGRPVVNGVSGYDPRHYELLQEGLARHDPRVLVALAGPRGLDVVISTRGDRRGQWEDVVSAMDGVRRIASDGQRVLYRVPPNADMTRALGPAIPVRAIRTSAGDGAALIDGNLETAWEDGPQQPGQRIELDLGGVRAIGGVALALRDRVRDYPRALRIDVSSDGRSWRTVFDGPLTGWAVWSAALTPLDATLTLALPSTETRYVRLEQTMASDRPWVMAEVVVHQSAMP